MEHKATVVIVEDEKTISNLLQAALKVSQYNAVSAKNVAEAETIICSHCPDVILLDLGLPDGDGLNLIRTVRKWSQVPIIVVSARRSRPFHWLSGNWRLNLASHFLHDSTTGSP